MDEGARVLSQRLDSPIFRDCALIYTVLLIYVRRRARISRRHKETACARNARADINWTYVYILFCFYGFLSIDEMQFYIKYRPVSVFRARSRAPWWLYWINWILTRGEELCAMRHMQHSMSYIYIKAQEHIQLSAVKKNKKEDTTVLLQ